MKEFGVERKSIGYWMNQLSELNATESKSNKYTTHPEKRETNNIEAEIVEWILMNRSLLIAVNSWKVIIKKLKEDLK